MNKRRKVEYCLSGCARDIDRPLKLVTVVRSNGVLSLLLVTV